MKNYKTFAVTLILIYVFFLNSIPFAAACGPFTVDPYFSLTKHADYPLMEYNSGKVGVVPTSYGRMSLFVYYRELNNLPLTEDEQALVKQALDLRIGNYGTNEENQNNVESSTDSTEQSPDFFQRWKTVRAKVLNVDVKIPIDKKIPDEYVYYQNCLPDAFNTASKTLETRIAQYGVGEDVKDWLRGQDAVFSNCGGNGTMPVAVSANAPQWLKNDRQYQIAATYFYDDKYSEARAAFEKIAADKNSVWSKTANFVVARTYIRQASLIDDESPDYEPTPTPRPPSSNSANSNYNSGTLTVSPTPTPKIIVSIEEKKKEKTVLLDQATERLRNILTDSSMNEFQPSARRLFGLVRYRNNPAQRQQELADTLTNEKSNPNIKNDLIDYIWLLDKIESSAQEKGEEIDRAEAEKQGKADNFEYNLKIRDIPANQRQKDLTDWLFTYQAADGFAHAYDQWKATGKAEWLTISLIKADKNSPQVTELLAAGDKIARNSAAYADVRYQQIRLLLENDKRAEAKQKLDEVFANNLKEFPISTQNKFLAQRMAVAANLDEFLKYAQRHPTLFVWSDDGNEAGDPLGKNSDKNLLDWKNRTMFDEDSVAFFNEKMPLSVLREAAFSPQLPDYLKKFLVVATWTRAVILGNQTVEREFMPLMSRYAPDYNDYFSKYAAAVTPANREAAALITILRYPVIEPYVPVGFGRETSDPTAIDSNRGNWWCAEDQNKPHGEYAETVHYDHYDFEYPKVYPNFLTSAQTAEATREHQQILDAGNSATFLTRRAVDFAGRNPNNLQTPELLHLAVRSTRYGCTDAATTDLSKQAFDILHRRFPRSAWTQKTPYWF